MDPSSPQDKYWAATDEEEFAKLYWAKVQQQGNFNGYGELVRLQRLAYRHYYGALPTGFIGDMPSSAVASRAGEQGENVEVRVNWLYAHVNAKHQIIVAPKLAWGCQATNTDSKSMADSSRGGNILEYRWKSTPAEVMAVSAVLGAILAGEEFVFAPWNPQAGKAMRFDKASGVVEYEGDIERYAVPSWCVLRQQNVKSFDESPWLSAMVPRNRWDLIAQHPEMRDAILAVAAQTSTSNQTTVSQSPSDPDIVVTHYFFHKKTPALPKGLQAVILSADCVLEFQALEPCYEHIPIHRFRAKDLKGTPFAYTSLWEAMGIQDLVTDMQGSLATNIVTFAKQMITAESDQNLPIDQLGNGPAVIYRPKGSAAPAPLNLMSASPEMFKHLERLKADQRMVLGLNDMAMGEPPQGPPNAQAWALLATANITNNSDEQRGLLDGVRSMARSELAIIKAKMDTPRKVAIVGVHGASIPKQDSFDKSDFHGIDDVTIEIENPLMQTAAGRLPIAQMFIDLGFVQVPEQIEQLITTGKLEPLTQELRDELIYIAWESEQILKGINPPVMISDSHQMHYRLHKGVMSKPEGRQNVEAINAYNAHQAAHAQMELNTDPRILAMSGQAAPAQPAPGAPPADTKKAGPALAPPGAAAQGEAAGVKLPKSPVDPSTGSPAAPPGGIA